MKAISRTSLPIMALAVGALFAAHPVWADDGPTNVENEAAMALSRKIAAMPSPPFDPEAARVLARNNACFRCHSLDKPGKVGPTWSSVADRFGPLPPAVQPVVQERLIYHFVSGEAAEFETTDGSHHVEFHRLIHTDPPMDPAQIKNLVNFILSLKH